MSDKIVYDDKMFEEITVQFGNGNITPKEFVKKSLETGARLQAIEEAIKLCSVVLTIQEKEEALKELYKAKESKFPLAESLVIKFFFHVKDNSDLMRCFMFCSEMQSCIEKNNWSLEYFKSTPGYNTFAMNFKMKDEDIINIYHEALVMNEIFKHKN